MYKKLEIFRFEAMPSDPHGGKDEVDIGGMGGHILGNAKARLCGQSAHCGITLLNMRTYR
jgi:hypothetical protein